jgi:hypothetical protein
MDEPRFALDRRNRQPRLPRFPHSDQREILAIRTRPIQLYIALFRRAVESQNSLARTMLHRTFEGCRKIPLKQAIIMFFFEFPQDQASGWMCCPLEKGAP